MKQFFSLMAALLFNTIAGGVIASAAGLSPVVGAVGMNVVGAVMSSMPRGAGRLCAGVYVEVWTGELVKALDARMVGDWLDGIADASNLVNNEVIHLVDAGVDPDVLVNNTTYPIPYQNITDADITISLDKYQTKPTPVTDDELYAISYDKISRVVEGHGRSISISKYQKAAYNFCPQEATDTAPVLTTSGKTASDGRVMLCVKDLVNAKRALDNLKVPAQGRRLVLNPDHVNDLLLTNQSFREQYNINRNEGKVGRLYGFDIYEFANNPIYNGDGVKKDLGATADTGEYMCSFAFYAPRVFKATGSTKMYYRDAVQDPENQQTVVGFRHMFIALPKKMDANVVIMSGYSASSSDTGSDTADDD